MSGVRIQPSRKFGYGFESEAKPDLIKFNKFFGYNVKVNMIELLIGQSNICINNWRNCCLLDSSKPARGMGAAVHKNS